MKALKWLRNIALGLLSLIILVYVIVLVTFHISRYTSRREIVQGSQIMQLTAGPMEYAVKGEGSPILFFHGAGGGYDQISAFAIAGHKVIAPSRPGYLRTPLLDEWKSYEQASAAYIELLDSLGIEKVTVGGISAGGPSAIVFAMNYPERVDKMLLISAISKERENRRGAYREPMLNNFFGEDFMAWVTVKMVHHKPEYILGHPNSLLTAEDQKIILNSPEKAAALFKFIDHSYTFHKQRDAGHLNDIIQYATMGEPDPLPIAAPTLIIHGDHDTNVAYEYALSAAQRLPHATLYTVKDAGHLAIVSHHEEIMKQINLFLDTPNPNTSL